MFKVWERVGEGILWRGTEWVGGGGEGKAEIGPEGVCVRVSVMVDKPSFA